MRNSDDFQGTIANQTCRSRDCVAKAMTSIFWVYVGLFSGCQSLWNDDLTRIAPQAEIFTPTDSDYIPHYLRNRFSGVDLFNKRHSTVELASDGVKFIEELNLDSNTDSNSPFEILDWSQNSQDLVYKKPYGSQSSIFIRSLKLSFDEKNKKAKANFPVKAVWPSLIDSESVLAYWKRSGQVLKIQRGVLQSSNREFYARNLSQTWNPTVHDNGRYVIIPHEESDIGIYDLVQREFKAKIRSLNNVCQPQWMGANSFVFSATDGLKTRIYLAHASAGFSYQVKAISESVFRTECPVVSQGAWMMAFFSPSQTRRSVHSFDLHVIPNPQFQSLSGDEIRRSVVAINVSRNVKPLFTPDGRKIVYAKQDSDGHSYIEVYDLVSAQRFRYARKYDAIHGLALSNHGVLAVSSFYNKHHHLSIVLTNQSEALQGDIYRSFSPNYSNGAL